MRRRFYLQWLKRTMKGKLAVADTIAFVISLVAGLVILAFPPLQNVAGNLLWQIPLVTLLALLVFGFFAAPFEMYKEKEQEANSLKRSLNEIENARPRLTIEFQNNPPFCVHGDEPLDSYWLRVRVTNSGKSLAKTCVGKLVQFEDKGGNVMALEPLKLHWVGTPWDPLESLAPISLSPGNSEFLDVLITRAAAPAKAFLYTNAFVEAVRQGRAVQDRIIQEALQDFALIDHLHRNVQSTWWRLNELLPTVREIEIAIYSDNADPKTKRYSITWQGNDYSDIRLEEA